MIQSLTTNGCTAITGSNFSDPAWDQYQSFLSGPTTIDGKNLQHGVLGLLPAELQAGALSLCTEFYQLRTSTTPITTITLPQVLPWFHNEDSRKETRGRDLWQNTQPWKPLFIEWEALYFHIPFEKWKFKEFPGYNTFGNKVVQ